MNDIDEPDSTVEYLPIPMTPFDPAKAAQLIAMLVLGTTRRSWPAIFLYIFAADMKAFSAYGHSLTGFHYHKTPFGFAPDGKQLNQALEYLVA